MRKHSGISGNLSSPPRFAHIHKYIFSMSHDCTTSNVGEVNAAIVDSKEECCGVRGVATTTSAGNTVGNMPRILMHGSGQVAADLILNQLRV